MMGWGTSTWEDNMDSDPTLGLHSLAALVGGAVLRSLREADLIRQAGR